MALIKCPKCGSEISDKAAKCPQCGVPISNLENLVISLFSLCILSSTLYITTSIISLIVFGIACFVFRNTIKRKKWMMFILFVSVILALSDLIWSNPLSSVGISVGIITGSICLVLPQLGDTFKKKKGSLFVFTAGLTLFLLHIIWIILDNYFEAMDFLGFGDREEWLLTVIIRLISVVGVVCVFLPLLGDTFKKKKWMLIVLLVATILIIMESFLSPPTDYYVATDYYVPFTIGFIGYITVVLIGVFLPLLLMLRTPTE